MITILVIDADPAVRLVARRVLERAGVTVIAAADRGSALARLASLKVDLVICDIGEDRNGGPAPPRPRASHPGLPVLIPSPKGVSPAGESAARGHLGQTRIESALPAG